MKLAHFYHVNAAGRWREIVAQHFDALDECGLDAPLFLGVVGPSEQRREVVEFVRSRRPARVVVGAAGDGDGGMHAPKGQNAPMDIAGDSHQIATMMAVREYAEHHDGAVLFAQTRGARHQGFSWDENQRYNGRLRRMATDHVIRRWRELLAVLDDGCDVAGFHLRDTGITGSYSPASAASAVCLRSSINYWMARCDYLRRLPASIDEPLGYGWIGCGDPRWFEAGRKDEQDRDTAQRALNRLRYADPAVPPAALIECLDDDAIAALADRLAPHLKAA